MLSKFLVILVSVLAVFVSSEARLYGRRSLRREPTKRSLFSKRQIKNRSNRRLVTFKSAKKQFAKRQKDWNDGYLWNFKADEMNDHQVGWGQPSHVGPQKMNGQGWYDEMNDHQVGWGDQPSHVGPQRPNGQGWYDEMNDHQVGWGDQPSHVGPQKMNGQGWYDEMNDHQVGGWGWPDSFHK